MKVSLKLMNLRKKIDIHWTYEQSEDSIWSEGYAATKFNEVLSGYQPRQVFKQNGRFEDHNTSSPTGRPVRQQVVGGGIYTRHRELHWHITSLMMGTKMVLETWVLYRHLTRLITREHFIESEDNIVMSKHVCLLGNYDDDDDDDDDNNNIIQHIHYCCVERVLVNAGISVLNCSGT
jgi:hypothetical protein